MFTTPNKHVMSAYIPSVSMSDRPEDGDYLLCLASTSTVMTKILQLRKESCIKYFVYTNKGTTYKSRNKNNRDHKPLKQELPNLRMRQYFHPQRDRID